MRPVAYGQAYTRPPSKLPCNRSHPLLVKTNRLTNELHAQGYRFNVKTAAIAALRYIQKTNQETKHNGRYSYLIFCARREEI